MANGLDAYIAQLRKEQAMQDAMGVRMPAAEVPAPIVSPAPVLEPKVVSETKTTRPFVSKESKSQLLNYIAGLEEQQKALESQFEAEQRSAQQEIKGKAANIPMGPIPGMPSLGEKPLPRTYEALQAGQKRLEELQAKMAPPKEAPDLLAEALIAGIPTILGTGIGAAIGRPGMLGAGLAAGAGAGEKALAGVKASEKEQRAAQIKAAEERLQRQTTLEKSYLDAVAKAENYPMEAALIASKAASPEIMKNAFEGYKADLEVLKSQAKDSATKTKLDRIRKQLDQARETFLKGLAPGTQEKGTKIEKGTAAEKITDAQTLAAGFARRMEQAEQIFKNLSQAGYSRGSKMEALRSMGGPIAMTEMGKQQDQAERNFVTAVLRKESGAAISKSEEESERQKYFERAGDSPAVIQQKAMARAQAIENMKASAGPAYGRVPKVEAAPAAAAIDPRTKRLQEIDKRLEELKKGKK